MYCVVGQEPPFRRRPTVGSRRRGLCPPACGSEVARRDKGEHVRFLSCEKVILVVLHVRLDCLGVTPARAIVEVSPSLCRLGVNFIGVCRDGAIRASYRSQGLRHGVTQPGEGAGESFNPV